MAGKQDCVFCRIIAGEIPANLVYNDEDIIAFHDIQPVAPVHIVVIPKRHIASLAQTMPEDTQLLGRILAVVRRIADEQGLATDGYRLVVNCGKQAGQSVPHLHFHILGGRELGWPPG